MGMIDVGSKEKTVRVAKAAAVVKLNKELIGRISNNDMPKGDVLETARVAGMLAAKNTSGLIPLCHNIELDQVAVEFILEEDKIRIESTAKATAKTGVEMEAMTASCVAALNIYDMCKMFLKSIEITDIVLLEKSGGRSGLYTRK